MALTKSTAGDRLILRHNMKPMKPLAAYTTAGPAVYDLVKQDVTLDSGVNRCASGDPILGVMISTNSGNGTLSIAQFVDGVTYMCDYTGALIKGDKVVSNGDRGLVLTTRDRVKRDNTNGLQTVIAIDAGSPGGTGTCVISKP